MSSVVFYVVVVLAGHPPLQSRVPMQNMEQCLQALHDTLTDDTEEMKDKFEAGGSLQASCVIVYPPFGKRM